MRPMSIGAFTIGLVVAAFFDMGPARAARPARIGSEPQLFVDDVLVATKEGVVRRIHPCRKLQRPVVEPEHPWEGRRVYVYGSVCRDDATDQFVMWYASYPPSGDRDKLLRRTQRALVNYATSSDGIHWVKPNLGLYQFRGSKENNIVWDLDSPSVIVDSQDPDPSRRYKMAGLGRGGVWIACSPDGIHWRDFKPKSLFPSDDTLTWTLSPQTGEYLVYHKGCPKVRGYTRRSVYLASSKDLERWTPSKLILAADETDDRWVKAPGQRTEFYDMSVFSYGGQFLGIAATFRMTRTIKSPKPDQSGHDGPIHGQLVHSRDGHTWHRLDDRTPVIPNGPAAFDAGCILGMANTPVLFDDEIWLYYTAITTGHGGAMPEKRITIGRAAWRRDGFVSLDAGKQGGLVETVPLELTADRLIVNADASHCRLAVEVLDAAGKVLPGYSKEECIPLEADAIRHPIEWKTHDQLPADQSVRLRFHLKDAKLYSYRVQPSR